MRARLHVRMRSLASEHNGSQVQGRCRDSAGVCAIRIGTAAAARGTALCTCLPLDVAIVSWKNIGMLRDACIVSALLVVTSRGWFHVYYN